MSITIKSGKEICNAPTNTSKSKQQYSFSKAPRFPLSKLNKGHTDQYYSLPNIHSTRSTNMGFGNRYDFTASQKNINSKFYGNYSDFDPQHPHGPKFSFANGRDKYEKVYIGSTVSNDKNVPGPGKYYILKPFGYDGVKFTIKGRNDNKNNNNNKNKNKKTGVPGPGQYPITVKINNQGKYPVSNISNISSLKFGLDKSKRFIYKMNKFPGPGTYDVKPLMGKIFDSKFRSYSGASILGKIKNIESRSNYPGPGSYVIPSDFGIYQSKDADKYPQENVYPIKKYEFEEKAWRHGMKVIDNKYMEKEEVDDNRKIDEKYANEYYNNNNYENKEGDNNVQEAFMDNEEKESEKPGRETIEVNNNENIEQKKLETNENKIENKEDNKVENNESNNKIESNENKEDNMENNENKDAHVENKENKEDNIENKEDSKVENKEDNKVENNENKENKEDSKVENKEDNKVENNENQDNNKIENKENEHIKNEENKEEKNDEIEKEQLKPDQEKQNEAKIENGQTNNVEEVIGNYMEEEEQNNLKADEV